MGWSSELSKTSVRIIV
jgi:hypothetical protein